MCVLEEGNVVGAADDSRPVVEEDVELVGVETILGCLQLGRIHLDAGCFLALGLTTVLLVLIFRGRGRVCGAFLDLGCPLFCRSNFLGMHNAEVHQAELLFDASSLLASADVAAGVQQLGKLG